MGFENREYYRDSYQSDFFAGGSACKTLIAVNVAVFVLQLLTWSQGDSVATAYLALDPSRGSSWRSLASADLGFWLCRRIPAFVPVRHAVRLGGLVERWSRCTGLREMLFYYGGAVFVLAA